MGVYLSVLVVGICLGLRYRVAMLGLMSALVLMTGLLGCAFGTSDVASVAKGVLLSIGSMQFGYILAALAMASTRPLVQHWMR